MVFKSPFFLIELFIESVCLDALKLIRKYRFGNYKCPFKKSLPFKPIFLFVYL